MTATQTGLDKAMLSPWAINPPKFAEIREVYARHLHGEALSPEQIQAKIGKIDQAKDQPLYSVENGVAMIAVQGVIAKRMNLLQAISGGTSTQLLGKAVREAIADPSVKSLVLNIDSPGGAVDGTQEVAREIFAARGSKPIVAYTDGMMASAAYWIGAAADQIYISGDTTEVGSIGVVATHVDYSKQEEMLGVKTTEIVAGKFKRAASAFEPLSTVGRATIQEMVDDIYSAFVSDVAKFRGLSTDTVLERMADGRIFIGQKAIKAGLVDGQRTLSSVVADLQRGTITHKGGTMSEESTRKIVVVADLQAAYPELVKAIEESAKAAGVEEGRLAGATAERERIFAVEAQALPGHEKLIDAMKRDGKTTGEQAAVQVLAAEKRLGAERAKAIASEAPAPVPTVEAPAAPVKESAEQKRSRLIAEYAKEHGCDERTASLAVSKAHRELFGL